MKKEISRYDKNMNYIERCLTATVQRYITFFSVVGITGPRQSGKSTLLRHIAPDYRYVSFDDYKQINLFYDDPEKFMSIYTDRVIFDEAQRIPELFLYIKRAVDQDRQNPGKFILSGSSQFTLLKNISESLAGRIGLLTLLPLQYDEMPTDLREAAIYHGCYPELVCQQYRMHQDWYASYLDTYLHKDIRSLYNIGQLRDFQRFLNLLSAQTAQIFNASRYATDLGIGVKTIYEWLSVLEASYIIFILPPYYKNIGKQNVKDPKVYFCDTGLAAYLTGIDDKQSYEKSVLAGALFENYVISEIIKKEKHTGGHAEFYYLRTQDQQEEIDLVIDRKQYREFIEIKKNSTFKAGMLDAVKRVMQENDRGYLLYQGETMSDQQPFAIMHYQDYLVLPSTQT